MKKNAGISGTIHHMIVIYGTQVENDNISSFFHFFKIWTFCVFGRVKGQKITHNHDIWYTNVKSLHPQVLFSFIQNFLFSGFLAGQKGKNVPN